MGVGIVLGEGGKNREEPGKTTENTEDAEGRRRREEGREQRNANDPRGSRVLAGSLEIVADIALEITFDGTW